MKSKIIIFIGWGLSSVLFMANCTKTNETKVNEVKEMKSQTYTCPMHPEITRTEPGTCPICGMDLVLNDHGSGEAMDETGEVPQGHARFQLSQARIQSIGVRFSKVQKKKLFKEIEASGRVAFDPELFTAQTEYVEALKQWELVKNSQLEDVRHSASKMMESGKLRLKVLGLSDEQIKHIAQQKENQVNLLASTIKGEKIWIYAEVFEMDLVHIRPGLSAQITGGAIGSSIVSGKVVSVDRLINVNTRTAKVRIEVSNQLSLLRPEAFVNVIIFSPLGEKLTVPFDAILDNGKQAWVFVKGASGYFEPRVIKIESRAGDEVAIGEGLSEGDEIVTSANFLIDSESRLKGVAAARAESGQEEIQCPKGEFWHAEMKHCMKKESL